MPQLNEKCSMENYLVGESNEVAYFAVQAVMESPGEVYNPLFVYGETGTGKTNTLNAIARFYKEQKPSMNIIYMTAEEMIRDICGAIRNHTTKQLKEKYSKADALIVDDIQRIVGKEVTREEFFRLIKIVHSNNKQVILSSNIYPNELEGAEEKIMSRFIWGLVVEVNISDVEMKKRQAY